MTTTTIPEPTTTDTREARGLRLAESRFDEIYLVSPGTWAVPSCSDSSVYLVKPRHSSCTCPDYRSRELPCKHVYAALVVRAKTAECSGCGGRSRRRDMVECFEDYHDGLTYFDGDQLCRVCADNAGVAYQGRVDTMCQKYERRCAVALQLREEALEEWIVAETLHEVRVAWGRLGGRVVLHRYGREHFSRLAKASRARS